MTKDMAAYGSSKGVVSRSDGVRVIATLIPPFIIEFCRRSHDRLILVVTCNLFTFSDLDGLLLPPNFEYSMGERPAFRRLAIENLKGMRNKEVKLSRKFRSMLPPAYQDEESEGEEASETEEESEGEEASETSV